jgi:hypothetical protein
MDFHNREADNREADNREADNMLETDQKVIVTVS